MGHTTVSVTKGIGIAPCGGRSGVALCVGGKGGIVEKDLALLLRPVRQAVEPAIRVATRDIVVC